MKKLNNILLIDDHLPDNFFHELVIEEANCAHNVLSMQEASKALDYLLSRNGTTLPYPELVFIDINMPTMNGFEFITKFRQLNNNKNTKTIFVMLTTSYNPYDKEKADGFNEIALFEIKPLDQEKLHNIFTSHFPDHKWHIQQDTEQRITNTRSY